MKKRIAFISDHSSPLALLGSVDAGGQNVYADRLPRFLAKLGYEVDVFTRWDDVKYDQIVEYTNGVRVVHIEAGPKSFVRKEDIFQYMDDFVFNMISFINTEHISYDLVHANFWMSAYVALKLKLEIGLPFVVTYHALGKERRLHHGTKDDFPEQRFAIEEQSMCLADMVIAQCSHEKEQMMSLYGASESNMTIIPSGYDPSEFYPMDQKSLRKKLGLSLDEKIVVQIGRMVERKGVDNVIRGVARMIAAHPDTQVRLLIVGGDGRIADPEKTPEIGRLMKVAREEGIFDQVTFVGARAHNELKYYYNVADIFVTTPWYEPFGVTPLESMGCGTPVIAAAVGGLTYTVVDEVTGYLVPAKDPDALGVRIADILLTPHVAKKMQKDALRHVTSHFTWEAISKRMAALYAHVIEQQEDRFGMPVFVERSGGVFSAE
jgi:glycosyltransferase involved in cell wall biosynthesis